MCDRFFFACVHVLVAGVFLAILYPMIYVVSSSFSSGRAVSLGRVILWPVEFGLEGYRAIFQYRDILNGYRNSLMYMVVGTAVNVCITMFCAYPLARKKLPFRNFFMFVFTFTMFFSGGLIPSYILMRNLGLINTFGAMVLPGAMSVYNMILARTFIQSSIPGELLDAAQVDGCSDSRYFFQILLPLCKAVLAVIGLHYAVGHWNAWFNAFLYINDRGRYPLQLVLREILVSNTFDPSLITDPVLMERLQGLADLLKYALIVVASVPMMLLYPFVQKFFIRGVMIGSIKG